MKRIKPAMKYLCCALLGILFFSSAQAQNVDFKQPRNGKESPWPIAWVNSVLNKTHSTYEEGMSVPQRIIITGVKPTSDGEHTLTFKHEISRGTAFAYDFLTSWDQAVSTSGGKLDQLMSAACNDDNTTCSDLRKGSNIVAGQINDNGGDPINGQSISDRMAAYEASNSARTFKIYGDAGFTGIPSINLIAYEKIGNNWYANYTVKWNSSSSRVMIEVAGHLAKTGDGTGETYTSGAGTISGAPYHFKLEKLDGASVGSRDNQIMISNSSTTTPCPDIVANNQNLTECETSTVDHTAKFNLFATENDITGNVDNVTLEWYDDNSNQITSTSSYTASNGTIVYAKVFPTDHPDCFALAIVTLNVNPQATVSTGSPQTICSDGTVTLNGSIGGSANSAKWTTNGDGSFDNDSKLNAIYTPGTQDKANYSVTLTLTTNDPDGPCTATHADVMITINPQATVSVTTPATKNCAGGIATYSLSGSIGGGASSATWSTSGDGTFSSTTNLNTTYTPGIKDLQKGTVDITLTTNDPAGPCGSASTKASLSVAPCGPNYSYTQGYYGNTGGTACTPGGGKSTSALIAQSIQNMSNGKLSLGSLTRSFTMGSTTTEISNLIKYMPGTQAAGLITPNTGTNLLTNITNNLPKLNSGKISNILLSQSIALALNISITGNTLGSFVLQDGYLTTITKSGTSCTSPAATCATGGTLSSKKITSNTTLMNLLKGKTVNDLLAMASSALGGILPANVSYTDISSAVDVINNSFDGGRYALGYFGVQKTCSSVLAKPASNYVTTDPTSKDISVSAYPNPFTNQVKFTIQSPVSGKGSLDIYNLLGQKVYSVYKGYVLAGRKETIELNVPSKNSGNLIYSFKVGGHQVNGKLIQNK
ncbi:T9SS type A sorting domain-containing protein [Segetibacter koreensis]|uniref:T9SS type A sorting domain-containing protein n=1 Tax=Segetibacter koreensis TaxID=398037 RepID=UPI00039FE646|nr:T9SS type A sorting domain-containing protein [Segetibacter koreensis]